jgi:hypothetical protein
MKGDLKMGLFSFLKGYSEVKAESAGGSIVGMLSSWDPEGASEADIRVMDANLDKLLKQAADSSADATREQAEADAINALYRQRLAGVEVLEKRKEGADAAAVAEIDSVILEELDKLEGMKDDILREEQEAVEAAQYVDELKQLCSMAAEKLKGARAQLTSARKDMERASVREQRAEEKAKRAAEVAGISSSMSKMSSALEAMKAKAAESTSKAEAHEMKSALLSNSSTKAGSMMDSAMAEASGKPSASTVSIADRLSALRK